MQLSLIILDEQAGLRDKNMPIDIITRRETYEKKLVTLLLFGTLMTAAACSGRDVADAGTLAGDLLQAKNTAQPSTAPESKPTGEVTFGDCLITIKMPNDGYKISCEDDEITFNYYNWKYGVLFPYEFKAGDGFSELDG